MIFKIIKLLPSTAKILCLFLRRECPVGASAAPPAVGYGFGPGGAPRPSARRANTPPRIPRPRPGPPPPRPLLLPPRRSRRCRHRPTATAQSPWELPSYDLRHLLATHRLHRPSWMPLATLLNCSLLTPSRVIHMPTGSDNSRLSRVTPQGVTSPLAGRRPCQPTFCRATLRTTNRLYRRMRIDAEQRKPSRNHKERCFASDYARAPRTEWLRCYSDTVLPKGARF